MSRWQRRTRFTIAVFGVVFAVYVARQYRRRDPAPPPAPVARTDQKAVVETTGGNQLRFTASREDLSVAFEKQFVYPDGSSKMTGVTIVTDEKNGSRTFTITGNEGHIAKNETAIALDGNVRVAGSDGMTVATEHATYTDVDATVHARGPVAFARGRTTGNGVGMTWSKNYDVLTILDQAVVHVAADASGGNAAEVTAGSAAFARRDKYIRFERTVRIQHGTQVTEADAAVAYLTDDEDHIDTLELKDHSRITSAKAAPGALQALSGRDMNLKYAAGGELLEHVLITSDAQIKVAGETGSAGRQITANVIDIALAPDGSTPLALAGRDNVQLTIPPEAGASGRTIRAAILDATGEPGKGLTRAVFSGNVQYRERGGSIERTATAQTLDVALKAGFASIEQARFAHAVRFEEGKMTALAAAAHYDLEKGTLALSGTEPGIPVPHVVNPQITVDGTAIDVTLAGPKLKAVGNVKSELKPAAKPAAGEAGNDVKMPSMLKQDQPVIVVGNALDYDGTTSWSTYSGAARLFQGDTTIKGDTITIDSKSGNLAAAGSVTTTTMLDQVDKDKKKQRVHSIATAKEMKYDDADRRMTYTTDAHMSGPDGDMTAVRIELYLKPSGDELERAEAFENVTLHEQNRETKGAKMVYTTANETYVVTGSPVKIIDECQRETTGKTLTFNKGTDRIVVDGGTQIRTQTKGGNGNCAS